MPTPGVSVVEIYTSAVNKAPFGCLVRCDRPQRVDEHPRSHVWTPSAVCRLPDVDAECGTDYIVAGHVRLESKPARLLEVC